MENSTVPTDAVTRFVTELLEAWNAHDPDHVAGLYAQTYEGTDVGEASPLRGPEAVRLMVTRYLRAFPDLEFTPQETIVQGQRAALVWRARGTHRGPLMNIPATNRPTEIRGMSLLTVADGKITRETSIWDVAGFLRSIGLLPEL
jgi:steroid delta-isomerase-like uncharacterized protein